MARYDVCDVHGCLLTLRQLLERTLGISKTDKVILLGDYIDRGPSSKQVLDYLSKLIKSGYNIIPLRGNHDDLLVQGRFSPEIAKQHLAMGGQITLQSFGVVRHSDIPAKYCDFIDSLAFFHEEPDFLCVHASLDVKATNPFTQYSTLMWSRLDYDDVDSIGRRVIAGHTPHAPEIIKWRVDNGKKILLDAGCCYSMRDGLGYLCAFDLDTQHLYFEKSLDATDK